MNFDLTEDEEMLKALAERFVSDRYGMERRKGYLADPLGFDEDNWRLLSELGLISAFFAEENGGMGMDDRALAIVFEAFGRGMVAEPLIDNIVLAGKLFEETGAPAQKDKFLHRVVGGDMRLALAHFEPDGRGNDGFVRCEAVLNGKGQLLSGQKSLVAGGMGADAFLVTARSPGDEGVSLYWVASESPGLTIRPVRMVDGSLSCALDFDKTPVDENQMLDATIEDIRIALARAGLARCSESLGIMEVVFAETQDYLRSREQFGVPLSSFQVLQHRLVGQYATIEQARALIDRVVKSDDTGQHEWLRGIEGARAFIAEHSVELGHEMIQMHGGMGVSDELWIGAAHKKLFQNSRYPSSAEQALDRYAGVTG